MTAHLSSDDTLKATIEAVQETTALSEVAKSWYVDLEAFLNRVKAASVDDFESEEYLKNLWEDTTVASTGNGSVIIAPAITDADFRTWFAKLKRPGFRGGRLV